MEETKRINKCVKCNQFFIFLENGIDVVLRKSETKNCKFICKICTNCKNEVVVGMFSQGKTTEDDMIKWYGRVYGQKSKYKLQNGYYREVDF